MVSKRYSPEQTIPMRRDELLVGEVLDKGWYIDRGGAFTDRPEFEDKLGSYLLLYKILVILLTEVSRIFASSSLANLLGSHLTSMNSPLRRLSDTIRSDMGLAALMS